MARIYSGLFLVTFATLAFEILLTRIFSVTLWYHFAFIAVSVAMFGLTAGSLAVYLRPAWFSEARTPVMMAGAAMAFGVTLVAAIAIHLALPALSPLRLSVTYAAMLVPFFFSGVCVCLALTRFPGHTNRMYAADLAGAALGCLGYVALLTFIDGLSAVFATTAIAIAGGFAFLPPEQRHLRQAAASLLMGACLLTAASNVAFVNKTPLLGFKWVKAGQESVPHFERWNAFSRITVHTDAPTEPVLWGSSAGFRAERPVVQAWLRMDALAGTLLTSFNGDLRQVDYLRHDITNLAHHLRPGAKTLVLGAGGGRDVLSALVFGSREVVAVEINSLILDTVNRRYGDFTGHLDRLPGVTFVHDEARSWVQRSQAQFDIVQASWIDTWAATTAGALAMTENSLYTLEAWQAFLARLAPGGLLTFTRAWLDNDPREAARLVSLAREALASRGVTQPEAHLLLVVNQNEKATPVNGNATILVSNAPFSADDVARLRKVCAAMGFRIALAPDLPDALPLLRVAASGKGLDELKRSWPYRLDAPTDDRPFFFSLLSLGRLSEGIAASPGDSHVNVLQSLLGLLGTVALLSVAFIAAPLLLAPRALRPTAAQWPLALYFAMLGLGFMFVELALLQRLGLFLGHPTYGIGVALFSLLLAGGAGSYLADTGKPLARFARPGALFALAVLVAIETVALPLLIGLAQTQPLPVRLAGAVLLLVPPGLLMGMAFPMGVAAANTSRQILPWLWGINGAASVLASVAVAVVSLELGIAANLWIGAACYVIAGLLLQKLGTDPYFFRPKN
jgi:hypothetical protein